MVRTMTRALCGALLLAAAGVCAADEVTITRFEADAVSVASGAPITLSFEHTARSAELSWEPEDALRRTERTKKGAEDVREVRPPLVVKGRSGTVVLTPLTPGTFRFAVRVAEGRVILRRLVTVTVTP